MANDIYTNLLEKTLNDMVDNPDKVVNMLEERVKLLSEEIIAIKKILRKIKKTPEIEKVDSPEIASPQ